jgi:phage terminase small subunit
MSKGDKLTNQDKKFVKEIVESGNTTLAVKKAFGIKDENYAGVKGHRMIRKDKIQKAIKSIADSIPDSLLVEKHLALLNKQEVVTKNNMTTGEVDVKKTGQIDAQAVKAGLDMAYKLKGAYAADKTDITSQGEKIIIMPAELMKKNEQ